MKGRLLIGLVALATGVALLPVKASAMTTTIGQLAPGSSPPANCGPTGSYAYDLVESRVAEGNSYTVPANGTITQWSTNAAAGAGQMLKLKVFRYLSGPNWLIVAHDGPRPLTPGVINTFDVNIPVRAGDVIGLNLPSNTNDACDFYTGSDGDGYGEAIGDTADGGHVDTSSFNTIDALLNVSATLVRPDDFVPPLQRLLASGRQRSSTARNGRIRGTGRRSDSRSAGGRPSGYGSSRRKHSFPCGAR